MKIQNDSIPLVFVSNVFLKLKIIQFYWNVCYATNFLIIQMFFMCIIDGISISSTLLCKAQICHHSELGTKDAILLHQQNWVQLYKRKELDAMPNLDPVHQGLSTTQTACGPTDAFVRPANN